MSELPTELTAIAEAIQRLITNDPDNNDTPLLTQALIVFEAIGLNDDEPTRKISYAVPTENFSISGAIGLAATAQAMLTATAVGETDPD